MKPDFAEQQLDRFASHSRYRLMDGRKGRPDRCGQGCIVESNDGQIGRHFQSKPVSYGKGAGRHVVIAGEDGRGAIRQSEHLLRRMKT